jgi:hypothetical protein
VKLLAGLARLRDARLARAVAFSGGAQLEAADVAVEYGGVFERSDVYRHRPVTLIASTAARRIFSIANFSNLGSRIIATSSTCQPSCRSADT